MGCVLELSAGDIDVMVFGTPAFQQYYMIHDNNKNQLGIAPMNNSKKTSKTEVNPVGQISAGAVGGPPWWAAMIVILAIFGGAFFAFYQYFMEYIETMYPDSEWIQAEIYTAYWFGVCLLNLFIRYLMMDLH